MPVPMLLFDEAGVVRFANEAGSHLFADCAEPLVGSPVTRLIPEQAVSEIMRHLNESATAGCALRIQGQTLCHGVRLPMDMVATLNTSGEEIVFQVVLSPVSETAQTEFALRRSLTDTVHAMAQLVEMWGQ